MIELSGINRSFVVGDQIVHALKDLSLSVQAGEYLSIMGPSGSGKSTLLNILGLLDTPDSGGYLLDSIDITKQDDRHLAATRNQKIGFIFQSFHLIPRLTALQNVELPLLLAGVAKKERSQRAHDLLAAFGLENRWQHKPDELSGGQRQRVAIARAVVTRPAVLLADEPTGNLDRRSSLDIVTLMEKLNSKGLTLVVVTHDPELGERAYRHIQVKDGRIISDEQRA